MSMESSMALSNIAALFVAMVVLAFIPSVSVIAVSARSAASGFIHGVFTTLGIVVADVFFILIAILSLSILAETLGSLFVLIKYLGGVYLMWLGLTLWRSKLNTVDSDNPIESSLISSFLAGLFITLADQKAILFYFGFFPAFIDLSTLSVFDTSIIIAVAIVAVGGVKLCYAYMADKACLFFKSTNVIKKINRAAGTVMIAVGVYLITNAGI